MEELYREDLAYIHDAGFGAVAIGAARLLIAELDRAGLRRGPVVDLGCGSGLLARHAVDAGFAVLGVDISAAFIAIARGRVPEAEFRVGSFLSIELPACVAVVAIGEVLSYAFDERNSSRERSELFGRCFAALAPGGLLMFDLAVGDPARASGVLKAFKQGPDWAVMAAPETDETGRLLTRRITSFRQVGALYRRDDETHRLFLDDPAQVLQSLRSAGFESQVLPAYAPEPLPGGVVAFLARKPRTPR